MNGKCQGWARAVCLTMILGCAGSVPPVMAGNCTPIETFKILSTDLEPSDELGNAIAIGGDYVVVGANHEGTHAFQSGAAYIFNATTGQQLHKLTLTGGEAFDFFGDSVAIS